MATSLHFGPEWMRKAPAKSGSSTSISASARSESPSGRPTNSGAGGAVGGVGSLGSSTASLSGGGGGGVSTTTTSGGAATRRNPSLGNLSSASGASLPAAAAVTSPGAFSFAAAAAGGNAHAAAAATANASLTSGTGTDKEETLLSYSHLSLYSSDDRAAVAPKSPLVPSPVDANGLAKKKPFAGALSDMPIRRIGEGAGVPLSPSLGSSEAPRGINARAFSSASIPDKAGFERPGLFQRGSSTSSVGLGLAQPAGGIGAAGTGTGGAVAQSPTIPRDRFGGIQGGVLSGVASQARKRKDSENGIVVDSIRTPRLGRFGEDSTGGSEDTVGVLRTRSRTSAAGFEGGVPSESGGGVAASQETTGSSLSARFKRDRLPGEGPIGPPADAGIGFGKFTSVNRKRERQASTAAAAGGGRTEDTSGAEPGVDSDLAADVLSSLKLDEEQSSSPSNTLDSELGTATDGGDAQQAVQPSHDDAHGGAPWSAETQQWVYRDPAGNEQGPFTGMLMQEWWSGNYFETDLLMRPASETVFVPLGQIFTALGHPAEPFLVAPPSPWSKLTDPPEQQQQSIQQENVQQHFEQQPQRHDPLAFSAPSFGAQADGVPFGGLPQGPNDFNNASVGGWGAPAVPELGGSGRGWPSLDLGFANAANSLGSFGVATHSPFGAPSPQTPFGGANSLFGGPAGLRQDDHLTMLRQRELQEQRHAAAAAAARGHTVPGLAFAASQFGGGGDAFAAPGSTSWDAGRGASWVASQNHLQHRHAQQDVFSSPQLQHQQQFQQQPNVASPWGNAPGTPSRTQFDQQPVQSPGHFQSHQQHQAHQPVQAPWVNDVQTHHEQQHYHTQQHKMDPAPIGTPRRARSPVQAAQDESFADVSYSTAPEPSRYAEDANQPAAAAQPKPEPTPAPEPEPEEVWPQSPSAVEFAAEPTLEQQQAAAAEDFAASASSPARSKRSRRRGGVKEASDSNTAPTANVPGAVGVRLLSQEAFRREQQQQQQQQSEDGDQHQVSLSNWLPESGSGSSNAPAKAPWAADAAAPTVNARQPSLSLRQIQEAEARQAEARRAAERAQRAATRSTSATAASASDDLPTTMTWGLASGRAGNASTPVEAPVASTSSNAAPVWNSATRPATKKTLTEIQEEERKRAEKVRQQQVAQAAALRRGYADSAAKLQPSVAPSAAATAGAGWSVVGAKPATPTAPTAAARPAVASASAAPRAASLGLASSAAWATAGAKTNGATASPAKAAPAQKTILVKNPSASEQPTASQPSADFMRYCKDQLKGLNVKTDDFIEMLLSFPLDPSPDVVEIIADSVYANSSTLDGRRFAADFVAKRKMDVRGSLPAALGLGHASASSAGATGAGRSASEVLKSKAAATGGDFGGFKVVKTKGGKKRA